ncbi:HesB/YadR/YfhF family protein [Neobacillus niacini]|uniref:HesB/YadR/YfhF family protein n=1 Tax=Neobacillus niacini TaxID=86668 RepID=UPI003B014428
MNIQISSAAAAWYKQELNLKTGEFVRFYVRYGGFSPVQKGFSLGISSDEPNDIGAKTTQDGITFYVEEKDLWYFDDHDLIVDLHEKYEEPILDYKKA